MRTWIKLTRVGLGITHSNVVGADAFMCCLHSLKSKQFIIIIVLDQQWHGRPAGSYIGPIPITSQSVREKHPGMIDYIMVQQTWISGHQADNHCGLNLL